MNPDPLEQRLADLAIEAPDAGRVTAHVLSRTGARRRSRLPRLIALGAATVLIATSVLYFVPAADSALADTPVAGDLLRDAGLTGAGTHVTPVSAVASSSGIRLQLVGAYADSTRTVLLIRADPAILPLGVAGFDAQLTDQFGRSYHMQSGQSDSRTGQVIAQFEPLAWPDSITGARITLEVTAVERACQTAAFCSDPIEPPALVTGSWTLRATLGVDEGTTLALPAPASLGPATFRFTSVRSTSATIAIEIDVTGATAGDLDYRIPDGLKGTAVFDIGLFSPTGDNVSESYQFEDALNGVHIVFLAFRSAPGDYHLNVSYLGHEFDRFLKIP